MSEGIPDFDPNAMVSIDVPCEFYLENREEPVRCLVAIMVTPEVLEHERGRDALMDMSLSFIMEKLNSRNELWAILPSKIGTRTVIVLDEIQSFSIQPPDVRSSWYVPEHEVES